LAYPFEERLFFAGEAAHVHGYPTAHGAHDSGVRAAEEAIAALTSIACTNATTRGEVFVLKRRAEQATRVHLSAWGTAYDCVSASENLDPLE
jgi:Flavin containing amine oxidoreductase